MKWINDKLGRFSKIWKRQQKLWKDEQKQDFSPKITFDCRRSQYHHLQHPILLDSYSNEVLIHWNRKRPTAP